MPYPNRIPQVLYPLSWGVWIFLINQKSYFHLGGFHLINFIFTLFCALYQVCTTQQLTINTSGGSLKLRPALSVSMTDLDYCYSIKPDVGSNILDIFNMVISVPTLKKMQLTRRIRRV